jgi:hypothetical protein
VREAIEGLRRSASADGHGDLKGYLDERSGALDYFNGNGMPLDIGWYYGYDVNSTPDQYEYILGATIGYDSSMSFQVSCDAAARHPFTGQILDLIARYEELRLSGRVPKAMRDRLRIDPALAGVKTPEDRIKLLDQRREYRLLGPEGREHFQRVTYEPWHEVKSAEAKDSAWTVRVREAQTRLGVQIHAQAGQGPNAQPILDPYVELAGKRWEWKGALGAGQHVVFWPDEPTVRYGLPLKQPEQSPENGASVVLSAGDYPVRFGCRSTLVMPVSVDHLAAAGAV